MKFSPELALERVNDVQRLEATARMGLAGTPPEECYDELTRSTARALHAPAAFLSVITDQGDFYKSIFQESGAEAPRSMTGLTFCHYAMLGEGALVLSDARNYPQFRDVPTIASMGVVAYLGIPLVDPEGQPFGAFCVVDSSPRVWTTEDVAFVTEMSRAALQEIYARQPVVATAGGAPMKAEVALPSFEELYDAHSGTLYAVLLRILRDEQDAQEVLQDAFLQAWKQLDRFDPSRGSIAGWLISIARSRGIDRLRKRHLRARVEEPLLIDGELNVSDKDQGARKIILSAEKAHVVQVLLGLPEMQRKAIELAYFDGLSQSEIAALLGEPLGTVKTRLLLGMKKLRQKLWDQYPASKTGMSMSATEPLLVRR